MVLAADGNFYGTTFSQGSSGQPAQAIQGTIFKMTPAGTLTTLYNFCSQANCADGAGGTSLIQGSDGNFYGTTWAGGVGGNGTVFKFVAAASTTPVISSANGVVSGASFLPGIAANSWITITGTNLSAVTDTWNNAITNGNLPTHLDGVSVMVGGQPAYIAYVSPTQINAVAPNVPAGTAAVTVTTSVGTSAAVNANAQAAQPAFFQWGNYAVASKLDYSLAVKSGTFAGVTTAPAKPGDVIILWGTGFGPTTPSTLVGVEVPSTATYNTATPVTVTIGGVSATVYGDRGSGAGVRGTVPGGCDDSNYARQWRLSGGGQRRGAAIARHHFDHDSAIVVADPGHGVDSIDGNSQFRSGLDAAGSRPFTAHYQRDGNFNVRRRGTTWRDIHPYFHLVNMSWPRFMAFLFMGYVVINTMFAAVYFAAGTGATCRRRAPTAWGRFLNDFFFSSHTLSTVGYGNISPKGMAANAVATFEALVGVLGFAVATGLLFGRVSRPSARIGFSENMLVSPYQDGTSLQFRLVNRRANSLMELEAKVMLMTVEPRTEKCSALTNCSAWNGRRSCFCRSPGRWSIPSMRTARCGARRPGTGELQAEVLILIKGYDDTFSQTVLSRHSYRHDEFLWNRRFAPAFSVDADGDLVLELKKVGNWREYLAARGGDGSGRRGLLFWRDAGAFRRARHLDRPRAAHRGHGARGPSAESPADSRIHPDSRDGRFERGTP